MNQEFRYQASLALNVVLAVAVLAMALHKAERAPAPAAPSVTPEKTTHTLIEAPASNASANSPRNAPIASPSNRPLWIDQLRAAGVPNRTLARAVLADLEEQWDRRVEEYQGDADKLAALQQERERDQESALRAALGEEGFRLWDQQNLLREASLGKLQLTAAEADALYDLKKQLQQRQRDLEQARVRGEMDDAEINDASDKAYSEFNQQMKALLGDGRYAKSQGQDDGSTAANLRQELAKVNPSDSQFQTLLKAQQRWNERQAELDKQFQDDASSAAYAEQVRTLRAARDQEYQRVLGTEAFDALQKEQDSAYSKMKKYRSIWGLDDKGIEYVYSTLKYHEKIVQDYLAQARALEAQGQSAASDTTKRSSQQLVEQTRQTLQNYLGQDLFNKMERNGVFQFNQVPERGSLR